MFRVISKIPFNWLSRSCSFIATLPFSLVFSVTYKCNYKCKTCNIWKDCNGAEEMSLPQIESVFRSLGSSLYWVTLDGGEPFLRNDLVEICEVIYKNCKPAIINLPSNGSLPEVTISCIERILKLCRRTNLIVNLSLDHIREKHDAIRGRVGSFQSLLQTYKGLKGIGHPRLRLGINTVISNLNIKDWEEIYLFVKELKPDSHLFEIAQLRDEFRNRDLVGIVPSREMRVSFLRELFHTPQINKKTMLGRWLHGFRKSYYSLIEKSLILGCQVIPCFAGIASAYILPDGKIWSCCNNAWLIGDLSENNFDFRKLWKSRSAKQIRKRIKTNRCFCQQVNTNYLNLLHNPFYAGKVIYDTV